MRAKITLTKDYENDHEIIGDLFFGKLPPGASDFITITYTDWIGVDFYVYFQIDFLKSLEKVGWKLC